jgi:hypothetical protein
MRPFASSPVICSCASAAAWTLRTWRSSWARACSAFSSAAFARLKLFALRSATAPCVASVLRIEMLCAVCIRW